MSPLLFLPFLTLGLRCDALSKVRVSVPEAALRGNYTTLHCYYDLDGDILYSVKWYKGRQEFYRYTPREVPSIKTFPIPGSQLRVEVTLSNATQVTLQQLQPGMSGRYSCEVSVDAPSFQTALVTGQMEVVTPPSRRPLLHGLRQRYRVGDTLRVNCTCFQSQPAANLSWHLNGVAVDKNVARVYSMVTEKDNDLETSTSIIEQTLGPQDFSSNNRIKVRCSASILNVYWQTTEKSAEWVRNKLMYHQPHQNVLLNLQTDHNNVSVTVEEPTAISGSLSVMGHLFILCWCSLILSCVNLRHNQPEAVYLQEHYSPK